MTSETQENSFSVSNLRIGYKSVVFSCLNSLFEKQRGLESLLAAIQAATEAFDFAHSTPKITCSLRLTPQTTDVQNYLPRAVVMLGLAALYPHTGCLCCHATHRFS